MTKIKVRKKDKSESKQTEDPKRQKVELKGPRVKHVCRSASIVLGQPIATFPTQEEKEKQEKVSDNENLISVVDKDIEDLSSCESEIDLENKTPIHHDDILAKDTDSEEPVEIKKRKIDAPVPVKVAKADSSEDETIMDLVPKKPIMKPLSNITNVSI